MEAAEVLAIGGFACDVSSILLRGLGDDPLQGNEESVLSDAQKLLDNFCKTMSKVLNADEGSRIKTLATIDSQMLEEAAFLFEVFSRLGFARDPQTYLEEAQVISSVLQKRTKRHFLLFAKNNKEQVRKTLTFWSAVSELSLSKLVSARASFTMTAA